MPKKSKRRNERQKQTAAFVNRIQETITTANNSLSKNEILTTLTEKFRSVVTVSSTNTKIPTHTDGTIAVATSTDTKNHNNDTHVSKRLTHNDNDTSINEEEPTDTILEFHRSPLPPSLLQQCLSLFQQNMGNMYESSQWGLNMNDKRDELNHDSARFLMVRRLPIQNHDKDTTHEPTDLLAFCHYRFEPDDEDVSPLQQAVVLYLYELQVSPHARRRGLGKALMTVLEHLVSSRSIPNVKKIMLTVFCSNTIAMGFYRDAMGYGVDETSPSRFVEDGGEEADYEILSKCVE